MAAGNGGRGRYINGTFMVLIVVRRASVQRLFRWRRFGRWQDRLQLARVVAGPARHGERCHRNAASIGPEQSRIIRTGGCLLHPPHNL